MNFEVASNPDYIKVHREWLWVPLYAGAAPVAQADKLDAEMFRWFMLGDRTTTDALLDLHMRQLNDDKPTLDEWRTAINAAMKGTP